MGNYCCSDGQSIARDSKNKKLKVKSILKLFNTENSLKRNVGRRSSFPLTDIEIVDQIGSGGQAEIFKVKTMIDLQPRDDLSHDNPSFYALKMTTLSPENKSFDGLKLGTELLISHNNPFLTKSYFSTTSGSYMYEIMQLALGGDLGQWLENTVGRGDAFRSLGDDGVKFVIAGVILGLEEIHRRGFVFRDLKAENILIGKDGYPMLCDFHLMGKQGEKIISEIHGTVTYLAPQLLVSNSSKENLKKSIDLWSLGILLFVLTYGEAPFEPEQVLSSQFYELCQKKENKYGLKRKKASAEAHSLINLLLRVHPKKRLTLDQIKAHEFFSDFSWESYQQKDLHSPLLEILKKYPIKILQTSQKSLIQQPFSPSKTSLTGNNKTLSSSQQF